MMTKNKMDKSLEDRKKQKKPLDVDLKPDSRPPKVAKDVLDDSLRLKSIHKHIEDREEEELEVSVVPAEVIKVEEGIDVIEKVVSINRITKVTKGGKKLSFSALVVVGDSRGHVGYNLSKASEVATAIRKAMKVAKNNMIEIPMKGTTIPHEIIGECGGARVLLKPAAEGTGVIAAGPVRAVCDGAGIRNILTKCHRSNNPINVVKATIDGLSRLKRVNSDS